jgi:hypothetical protein
MRYLATNRLRANYDALRACLISWVELKLDEAVARAGAALDAKDRDRAWAEIAAVMEAAGVEAAKECSEPSYPRGMEGRDA